MLDTSPACVAGTEEEAAAVLVELLEGVDDIVCRK